MLASLLLLLTTVQASEVSPRYASDSVPLVFEDVYEVFSVIAFDTGYLPSINDPISVRFHITPTGGVVTEARADRYLEWPDALEVMVVGEPGTGVLAVDTQLEIEAEIHLDIPLIFTGAISLWSEYVSLFKQADFDPLLLDPTVVSVDISGDGLVDPFEYAVNVIPAVLDVVLAVEVYPTLTTSATGLRVESTTAEGTATQYDAGVWANLAPPTYSVPFLEVDTDFITLLDSDLALVIEPSATVDIFGAIPITLLSFPIDVPLVDLLEERVLQAETSSHPMPILNAPTSLDAGEAELGGMINLPVDLFNDGDLALEGCAVIVGSDDFAVFPDTLYIPPGGQDGLMVSFSPVVAGQRGVVLELRTNDPALPVVEIPLTGAAIDPEAAPEDPDGGDGPPDDVDTSVNSEEIRGKCGCDHQGPVWWWTWLLLLPVIRRRAGSST